MCGVPLHKTLLFVLPPNPLNLLHNTPQLPIRRLPNVLCPRNIAHVVPPVFSQLVIEQVAVGDCHIDGFVQVVAQQAGGFRVAGG